MKDLVSALYNEATAQLCGILDAPGGVSVAPEGKITSPLGKISLDQVCIYLYFRFIVKMFIYMYFVFFFLGEYASIVLICILNSILFLGGYLNIFSSYSYLSPLNLALKTIVLIFVFI